MEARVSIAIVTWNRGQELRRALDSAAKQGPIVSEVVVVDNASIDNTKAIVEEFAESHPSIAVKYVKLHKNIGCPMARNIAFVNCTQEFIYALDDDGWLESEAISSSVALMDRSDKPIVIASKIIDPVSSNPIGYHSTSVKRVKLFSAGAALYRKKHLEADNYFPDYFRQMEESFFCYKAYLDKKSIYFNPDSIMYHDKTEKGRSHYQEVRLNFHNEIKNIRGLTNPSAAFLLCTAKLWPHFKCYFKNGYLKNFVPDTIGACLIYLRTKTIRKSQLGEYFSFIRGREF